jgi:hypothetical protein
MYAVHPPPLPQVVCWRTKEGTEKMTTSRVDLGQSDQLLMVHISPCTETFTEDLTCEVRSLQKTFHMGLVEDRKSVIVENISCETSTDNMFVRSVACRKHFLGNRER